MYKSDNYPRQVIRVPCESDSDEELAERSADLFISPELIATRVICATEDSKGLASVLDVPSLQRAIENLINQGGEENTQFLRSTLVSQSIALQTIFARLVERAQGLRADHISQGWMKLALKAQSQCLSVIHVLSQIRMRTTLSGSQTNIAAVQQVNNYIGSKNDPNELGARSHVLSKNSSTSGTFSSENPCLETVGKVYRTKKPRREATKL